MGWNYFRRCIFVFVFISCFSRRLLYLSVNIDVESFWFKIEIIYFVWLCVIVWFTLTQNFWYLKLINNLIFLITSIPTLNICQILMRYWWDPLILTISPYSRVYYVCMIRLIRMKTFSQLQIFFSSSVDISSALKLRKQFLKA